MKDLKKIIQKLSSDSYQSFTEKLLITKGDNFHFLASNYREGIKNDSDIMESLGVNSGAFYALKSRLHSKLKDHLSEETPIQSGKDTEQNSFRDHFYSEPREITISFLESKEADYKKSEKHIDLLNLYAIYKKVHFKSDKYYHYTQLYNKQLAFVMSLEKSESILAEFNFQLIQFLCSRTSASLDRLFFLRNEILNHQKLNPSGQIILIRNIIELQIWLFCSAEDKMEGFDFEEVIKDSFKIVDEMSESSWQKGWRIPLEYLSFEFYHKFNTTKATQFMTLLDKSMSSIMLHTDVAVVSNYLLSRISFLGRKSNLESMQLISLKNVNKDPFDVYADVCFGIYGSIESYLNNKLKDSVLILNKIINQYSFKDFLHINIELKLIQTFYYIEMKDFDLADGLIKSVYRKLKSEEIQGYEHVFDLIKAFTGIMDGKSSEKIRESFTLFEARNKGRFALFPYFQGLVSIKINGNEKKRA